MFIEREPNKDLASIKPSLFGSGLRNDEELDKENLYE